MTSKPARLAALTMGIVFSPMLACEATASAKGATEGVVYSFNGGADGIQPIGDLICADGVLYGTTEVGGSGGSGTAYSVTVAGIHNVLYSFAKRHGIGPAAGLVNIGGTFYGTTIGGGGVREGRCSR